jgi:gluconokinase
MVIVLMGPAGAGKTTIGRSLSVELGWRFVDGDDLQPHANVDKMSRGDPLTDGDRASWLAALHTVIARAIDRREHLALACSALKERYRSALRADLKPVRFVYLQADASLLQRRLEQRPHHFAGPALLTSQLTDLEEPADALTIEAANDPSEIVHHIRREFGV